MSALSQETHDLRASLEHMQQHYSALLQGHLPQTPLGKMPSPHMIFSATAQHTPTRSPTLSNIPHAPS